MLTLFELENFYSFRDRQRLDLTVDGTAPQLARFRAPLGDDWKRVATVAAVFGPNASGKTNLIRALEFFVQFARGDMTWETGKTAAFLPFAQHKQRNQCTRFYCEATGTIGDSSTPQLFSYEAKISALGSPESSVVEYECLRYQNHGWRSLLERNGQQFRVGQAFGIKADDPRLGFVTEGASALSTLAKFNHELSKRIVESLRRVHALVGNKKSGTDSWAPFTKGTAEVFARFYLKNADALQKIRDKIRLMDLGITDIKIDNPDEPIVMFKHEGLDETITFSEESEGTKRFFGLFPLLDFALQFGGLVIIDELDGHLHPVLIPELIDWFHNAATNPFGAQLIFTGHNASVMEALEKEEVHIVEKDRKGCSNIFGLSSVRGLRRDANLYRKYLGGQLGGLPHLG